MCLHHHLQCRATATKNWNLPLQDPFKNFHMQRRHIDSMLATDYSKNPVVSATQHHCRGSTNVASKIVSHPVRPTLTASQRCVDDKPYYLADGAGEKQGCAPRAGLIQEVADSCDAQNSGESAECITKPQQRASILHQHHKFRLNKLY